MPTEPNPINIAVLEDTVQGAIVLDMCPVVDTYMCCQLKDPCADPAFFPIRQSFCKTHCDNIITWQTFKCLFFNGPGASFGLNKSRNSILWNGSANKMISFDGCYRKTNAKCVVVDTEPCSQKYCPLDLRVDVIHTWQNVLLSPDVTCIPQDTCWDPCNKLYIERDLDKICSLHDVLKTCSPTCALTWNEVLRKILTSNTQSLVANDDQESCVVRHASLIKGYCSTVGDVCTEWPAIQEINIGVVFSNGNKDCPPILVNFNYFVYFGDPNNLVIGQRQIDNTLFDCICGSCGWVYPTQTASKYVTNFRASVSTNASVPPSTTFQGLNLAPITSWNADGITYVPGSSYGNVSSGQYNFTELITLTTVDVGLTAEKTFIVIPATWCETVLGGGVLTGRHYICSPNKAVFSLDTNPITTSLPLIYDPDNVNILENSIVYEITNPLFPDLMGIPLTAWTLTIKLWEDPITICPP